MKTGSKIFITFLCLSFITYFVACTKSSNEKDNAGSSKSKSTTSVVSTEDIQISTTKPTTEAPQAPVQATTAEVATTRAKSSKMIKQYKTKEEVVKLYNDSSNKVKPFSKVATRNYQHLEPLSDFATSGPFADVIEKNFYRGTITKPLVCSTTAQREKHFPLIEQNYTSHLKANMVSSAICTYENGVYSLTIKLKNDPDGTQKYSSSCFSVVSPKIIADNANVSVIKEKNITATCKGCIIKATIDEKTGNMLSMYYKMPTYLAIKVIGTNNTFAFYVEQDWTITW